MRGATVKYTRGPGAGPDVLVSPGRKKMLALDALVATLSAAVRPTNCSHPDALPRGIPMPLRATRRPTRGRPTPCACRSEPLEPRRMLSAGDLDPTFGAGGKLTTDLVGGADAH